MLTPTEAQRAIADYYYNNNAGGCVKYYSRRNPDLWELRNVTFNEQLNSMDQNIRCYRSLLCQRYAEDMMILIDRYNEDLSVKKKYSATDDSILEDPEKAKSFESRIDKKCYVCESEEITKNKPNKFGKSDFYCNDCF